MKNNQKKLKIAKKILNKYKSFSTSKEIFDMKDLYKLLKSKYKNVNFVFDERDKTIYTKSWIHSNSSNYDFKVHINSPSSNAIEIMFTFGEVPFNFESLFLVNKLCASLPKYMKTLIYKNKYEDYCFIIESERYVKNVEEAEIIFSKEMDYINYSAITNKINPIYYLICKNKLNIKEMN